MSLIGETKKDKILTGNILTIGAEASREKKACPSVVNSTVGMLNGEDGDFWVFKSVKEAMAQLSGAETLAYSGTKGEPMYYEAIKKWLFQDTISYYKDSYIDVVATPGGSGAIACIFENCLDEGDDVLVPSFMWEMYISFAREHHHGYVKYELFDEFGNFNIASVKEKIDYLLTKQKRIVLLVNDPCHNPTGYCMKQSEYEALVDLLNSYDTAITLLMDTAYYDYYSVDGSIIRKRYTTLAKLEKANVIFAVSGSKSLGLYGLRVGAAVLVTKSAVDAKEFANAFEYTARANWSSTSRLGLSLVEKCILDDDLNNKFYYELLDTSSMLIERAEAFKKAAKECDLPLLPYEMGFFCCVKTDKSHELFEALKKKKVYAVPVTGALRIALCAISKKEAEALPKIIKECLNEVE